MSVTLSQERATHWSTVFPAFSTTWELNKVKTQLRKRPSKTTGPIYRRRGLKWGLLYQLPSMSNELPENERPLNELPQMNSRQRDNWSLTLRLNFCPYSHFSYIGNVGARHLVTSWWEASLLEGDSIVCYYQKPGSRNRQTPPLAQNAHLISSYYP